MPAFIVVWIGQLVSVLATQMTQFAITIWAYEKTGSVTALALVQVFSITPFLLISPIAGAMIDRYNRKLMMALSDLGAGLATVGLLALQAAGALEVWHLYVAAAISGTFGAFQWPAYSASISLMVPKEQLGRANGLMSLMESGPGVLAPLMAGALLPFVKFTGILLFDVVTFVIAIAALAVVFVPQPPRTEEGAKGQGNLLKESAYGFRYILERPSLLGLQLVFFVGNFFGGIFWTLLAPMVLARTGNSEWQFGAVQTAGAVGGILGGVLLSLWGGFKRRVHGVLAGHITVGLFGNLLMALGLGLPVWMAASFLGAMVIPLLNGSNQAIWQSKVAPDVQGRVFSARRLIAWVTNPITPLIAGVLADQWLEPAMRIPSTATSALSPLFGTGPGTGMAVLMAVSGLMVSVVGAAGYLFRAVRDAEDILPDHDSVKLSA
ncbi:MAG: MFS transporter [Anaerolineae bacterium]|nr:MFS transporter [Anaerolineae bacterium]